jgi:predicted RNase H-like nuclease (RuvC/YqgF family)
MGRRPSDQEYKLNRQLKELKELNQRLEDEIKQLKKKVEKPKVEAEGRRDKKKPAKVIAKPCPDCGAETKITELPHAKMELCSAGCGYRNVRSKK